jgi:hypothetical protein
MAITVTDLGTAQSSTGHGSGAFTTGSFTPTANSLLVAIVHAVGDSGGEDIDTNITIADSLAHTWAERPTGNIDSGWSAIVRIYTAPNTPTTAFTITLDCGGDVIHDYVVTVLALEGYDTGTPTGATASENNDSTNIDGANTITLSAPPASDSVVVAGMSHVPSSGITGITHGTGWTEVADNAVADWLCAQAQTRTGSTSTSVTWDDVYVGAGSGFRTCSCAVEIKAAGASAVTINPGVGSVPQTGRAPGLGFGILMPDVP